MVWYKVSVDGKTGYTPFKQVGVEHFYFDPERNPTPAEIVEMYKKDSTTMYMGDGYFERSVDLSEDQATEIPPGVYRHESSIGSSGREGIVPHSLREDTYLELDGSFNDVLQDIEDFKANAEYYKEINALHKVGILLYGPQGTGKTICVRHVLRTSVDDEAVVIVVSGDLPSQRLLTAMRETIDDRLKVFVFEELTTALNSHRAAEKILQFLDGENSLNNKIVLATTNYPENLPENIVNRPARFDKIYKFGPPTKEGRTKLLRHYLVREPSPEEVEKTKGNTVAEIKEIVNLMKVSKVEFLDAIKRIENRKRLVQGAFKEVSNNLGF